MASLDLHVGLEADDRVGAHRLDKTLGIGTDRLESAQDQTTVDPGHRHGMDPAHSGVSCTSELHADAG